MVKTVGDPMDLKQTITQHNDGFSNRDIGGKILDISRNTVNTYMKLFKACDYFRTVSELAD